MRTEDYFSLTEVPALKSRALKMPYKGDRLSMVIILPDKVDGLFEVEKSLKNFDFSSIKFGDEEKVTSSLKLFLLRHQRGGKKIS